MATVHFLEQSNGVVHVVVHLAVPAGSNAAGVTWKNVILGAGLNTSNMKTGTLGGQITSIITQAVNNWKADFQDKYNYFGREI